MPTNDSSDSTLIVAVDIGTTYSGYAFSFGHQYKAKPLNITSYNWPDGPSYKTPTCVLLDPTKKFHSFGREAENKYINLAENEEHQEWFFVRRFKMLLMESEVIQIFMVLIFFVKFSDSSNHIAGLPDLRQIIPYIFIRYFFLVFLKDDPE